MNHADLRSAKALMAVRREMAQGSPKIYLDGDAASPRGWLSRRGRRLLDRSGILLSSAGSWLDRHSKLPKPPLDPQQGWSG